MKCPKCGTESPDTAKFCKKCGESLAPKAGTKACPSGKHTMDPTWPECPYCKQENSSSKPSQVPVRTSTMYEGRALTEKDVPKQGPPPEPVNQPQDKPVRESTVYRPAGGAAPEEGQPAAPLSQARKVVGVLVTYSWNPEGQVFPVREGRNLIGRDKDCEICIPEDQTLSGRNSHITYRQNFVVGDMISMAGTDLNGKPIEEQFHSLDNYATIRAGSTYFTFIVIKPQA